jgi:hypothetical protein
MQQVTIKPQHLDKEVGDKGQVGNSEELEIRTIKKVLLVLRQNRRKKKKLKRQMISMRMTSTNKVLLIS